LIFGLFSCQKDELTTNPENQTEINSDLEPKGMMVLGEQLENPYSVKNMTKAYESLKSSGTLKSATSDTFEVVVNTLYIRFLPKDSADLKTLGADTTIELFDYPMDYEIVEEGFYYHDPEIPEGQPTWQYTSVPVNYQFPEVQYEIIEECYIPDDDEDMEETELKSSYENDFYGQLELEAFRITGNLNTENTLKSTNGIMAKKKKPEGTIRVDNNAIKSGSSTKIGLEGVMKVKVRVHNFVKWDSKYTGEDGKYKMGKYYRTNIHYAVVFQNEKGFTVWGNWASFACANYNMGWHSNSGYSRDIYTNSDAWLWASVNNAAYIYREKLCTKFGVSKPPTYTTIWARNKTNSKWAGSAPMLRHVAFTDAEMNSMDIPGTFSSDDNSWYFGGFLPDVFIYKSTDSKKLYSTVFHELSHASHFSKVGQAYWKKYIAHIVNNNGYGNGIETDAGYTGVGEMWGNYFGNGICARDYFGSWYSFSYGDGWYKPGILMRLDDNDGFTPSELYSCLTSDVNTHAKLKSKLKEKYTKDGQVDARFGFYGF
jgi:hypothetical protein